MCLIYSVNLGIPGALSVFLLLLLFFFPRVVRNSISASLQVNCNGDILVFALVNRRLTLIGLRTIRPQSFIVFFLSYSWGCS